jgi:hypothetical protein
LSPQRHRFGLIRIGLGCSGGSRRIGGGRIRLLLHGHGVFRIRILRRRGLLALLLQLLLGEALRVVLENCAGFRAAGRQVGIDDLSRIGDVQVGEQRAQRIGR